MKIYFGVGSIALLAVLFFLITQAKHDTIIQPTTTIDSQSEKAYSNELFGFTLTPAPGFMVDESYLNQTLGPGREIPGVAFHIPAELVKGTNLSTDSFLAVEKLSDVDCEPTTFIDGSNTSEFVTIGENTFKKAVSQGAAAGNSYEDTVYVAERGDACYALRSMIHTTDTSNYDPGTIREYDKVKLEDLFRSMITSFILK